MIHVSYLGPLRGVYCGMRVLCVGRHAYLSDHLCRVFGAVGVQCEGVVGIAGAARHAHAFEPRLVIAESDLLSPSVLDEWSTEQRLHDVPVLAVSFTRRPEECMPAELTGVAGVIYLPGLEHVDVLALLHGARRPRGVDIPAGTSISAPRHTVFTH